jgi:hypothetical protein
MDSLVAKYLDVLNEDVNKTGVVKNAVPKPGSDLFGTPKAEDTKKQSKNVDIETPKEDKDNSCDECDGEPEKLNTKTESLNPFDELYNKILKEETFGWAIDEDESEGEESEGNEFGGEMGHEESETGEEEHEEEKEGLHAVVDHLKAAVSALEKLLDDADEEEGEKEGEEEGEEIKEEAVEAETLGHALVDQEKLIGGLTSKNNVVKAGVTAAKKKAEVPTSNKGHDGEVKKESESAGKQLTGKNNKVDGVKVGNLFNNK